MQKTFKTLTIIITSLLLIIILNACSSNSLEPSERQSLLVDIQKETCPSGKVLSVAPETYGGISIKTDGLYVTCADGTISYLDAQSKNAKSNSLIEKIQNSACLDSKITSVAPETYGRVSKKTKGLYVTCSDGTVDYVYN